MKKALKRVLSIVLCVLMAFGTMSVAFAAEEEAPVPALGAQFFLETTDVENSKLVLDELDKVLANANLNSKLGDVQSTLKKLSLTVDLNSVNGICKTLDSLKGVLSNIFVKGIALAFLGDIYNINLKTWEKGLKRGTKDYKILNEVVELIAANTNIIGKVIDGSADFGTLNNVLDLKKLLGSEGISGILKGLFVGMLYDKEKEADKYNASYNRAVADFDKFLFEELLPAKVASAVPGFAMNKDSKVDFILSALLASCWTKYLEPAIKSLNIEAGENVALQKLSTVMTFKGTDIDTSLIKVDGTKALSTQINDVLGAFAMQMFKGFEWEIGTDVKLVGKNIQKLYEYVAKAVGVEATPIAVLKFILANIEGEGMNDYVAGIDNCKNLEEVAKIVLLNAAKKSEIPVKEDVKSYENVLGDMLAYWANGFVDLGYSPATGKDVWTVLNDFVNVYLFDKGVAKALGISGSIKASDSVFKKLDTVIKLTGIWTLAGKNYKSEEFLKGILSGLFTLDFDKILSLTVVRFTNDFGTKSAVEVLYKVVYNLLKSLFGKDILVAYTSAPFQTALSNASLKKTVRNLLAQLNAKKGTILPPVLFATALALGTGGKVAPVVKGATAADVTYTGEAVAPSAVVVTINGKKVSIPSYQFTVKEIENNVKVGKAKAVVELNGAAKNVTVTATFNIVPAKVTGVKVSSPTSTSVKLSWSKAAGATGYKYEYFDGKKWVAKSTSSTSATISGLKAKTTYKFRVRAYNKTAKLYGEYSSTVSGSTAVAKVSGVKAKAASSSSVVLTWSKVSGAAGYEVWQLKGKKWVKVGTTTKTTLTVKKLKANTTYQFKVRAYDKKKVVGDFSSVVKVTTNLSAAKSLKAKPAATSVALTWGKVSGAKSYEIWQLKGKKWTKVATSSSAKYTVKKGIKKNTKYQFKVRAVSKAKTYGDFSSVVKTTTKKK